MSDFAKLLDRVYQSFLLRDVLGFVVPGGIVLISLRVLLDIRIEHPVILFTKTVCGQLSAFQSCEATLTNWQIITIPLMAYLAGWVLQAVHYGILRLVYWKLKPPFLLKRFLVSKFSKSGSLLDNIKTQELESLLKQAPLMTQGALEPDLIMAEPMTDELLKEQLKESPYSERLSALMIMSANLAGAIFILAVMLGVKNGLWLASLILLLISIALYFEFLRLWEARNLRVAIYAVEFQKRKDVPVVPVKRGL